MFLTYTGGNLEDGPEGIETYIHESQHIFDNIKSFGQTQIRYYASDSGMLLSVAINQNFVRTENIFNYLPDYLKNYSLTPTYIKCENNCIANSLGIYGLLEEFNAYSTGPRFLVEIYPIVDTLKYTAGKIFWKGFLKTNYDSWIKFYCFNIYFATYLAYIQEKKFDLFRFITTDPSFRNAFREIFIKYKNNLTAIDSLGKSILLEKINAHMYQYDFEEELKKIKLSYEDKNIQDYLKLLLL